MRLAGLWAPPLRIETDMTEQQVWAALQANVATMPTWTGSAPYTKYRHRAGSNRFLVSSCAPYLSRRHGLLPVAVGTIRSGGPRTVIDVTFRPKVPELLLL